MTAAPSRADLAARLADLTPGQRARLRDRINRQAVPGQGRLTPGQHRLWQTQQRLPGSPVDVVCQAVHLTGGPVDLDRLGERVRGFAERHEALRTTFEEHGLQEHGSGERGSGERGSGERGSGERGSGERGSEVRGRDIRPVVHEHLPPRLTRTRVTGAADAHRLARELAAEPFDLTAGPLLRVTLAEGPAPDESWLLVVVHNLVFDAWSFELLLDELARPEGTAPAAAPAFSGFAGEQRQWLEGPAGRAAAAYWAGEVADAPPPLPTDRPRPADGTARGGGRVEFAVSRAVTEGIAAAAQREAATAYTGWLAVAWSALAEFGGQQDVLLGTFTAGRDRPGTTEVAGYLLNVLPVRLREADDGSHGARTRAVRTATRAGLGHAAYPGELIAAGAEHPRVPGTHPLLDVVFVFDNLGADGREIQGARADTADLDKGTTRYDLTLAVYPGPDGTHGWLEYDTELYDAATARRLAERFTALAESAADGAADARGAAGGQG